MLAILVFFQYDGKNKLLGIGNDINQAISLCKKKGYVPHLLTDVKISEKSRKRYHVYDIINSDDIETSIKSILSKNENRNVLFYYNGHGLSSKAIKAPNGSIYPYSNILELFKNMVTNILFVFDCCHGPTMDLPYRLNEDGKLVQNEKKEEGKKERKMEGDKEGKKEDKISIDPKMNIVLISSSEPIQDSLSTDKCSIFSNSFLSILREVDLISLHDIVDKVQLLIDIHRKNLQKVDGYQTVSIYSSNSKIMMINLKEGTDLFG